MVPFRHRRRHQPGVRTLRPEHEIHAAENRFHRPGRHAHVLRRRACRKQNSKQLGSRIEPACSTHSCENGQLRERRWAELGKPDLVHLQHGRQKVVAREAKSGGDEGGEENSPIVTWRRDDGFVPTSGLAYGESAGQDKLGQVRHLDKGLAEVARPPFAKVARIFASRPGLAWFAWSHRVCGKNKVERRSRMGKSKVQARSHNGVEEVKRKREKKALSGTVVKVKSGGGGSGNPGGVI